MESEVNSIENATWKVLFHVLASTFYSTILFTFLTNKYVILIERMITSWYLALHMLFVFFRLFQDLIHLTPARYCKLNILLAKIINIFFISIIFPYAIYIPFVYWLLFYYNSSLIHPNFLEVSLASWVSTSSHSVIAVVALVEMFTSRYTYDGNCIRAIILLITFTGAYTVCLIGTYFQYGFWLYPVFHLFSTQTLPYVFAFLAVLLLLTFFFGKILAHVANGKRYPLLKKMICKISSAFPCRVTKIKEIYERSPKPATYENDKCENEKPEDYRCLRNGTTSMCYYAYRDPCGNKGQEYQAYRYFVENKPEADAVKEMNIEREPKERLVIKEVICEREDECMENERRTKPCAKEAVTNQQPELRRISIVEVIIEREYDSCSKEMVAEKNHEPSVKEVPKSQEPEEAEKEATTENKSEPSPKEVPKSQEPEEEEKEAITENKSEPSPKEVPKSQEPEEEEKEAITENKSEPSPKEVSKSQEPEEAEKEATTENNSEPSPKEVPKSQEPEEAEKEATTENKSEPSPKEVPKGQEPEEAEIEAITENKSEPSPKEVPKGQEPEESEKEATTENKSELSPKEVPKGQEPEESEKEATTENKSEPSPKEVPKGQEPEEAEIEATTENKSETSTKKVPQSQGPEEGRNAITETKPEPSGNAESKSRDSEKHRKKATAEKNLEPKSLRLRLKFPFEYSSEEEIRKKTRKINKTKITNLDEDTNNSDNLEFNVKLKEKDKSFLEKLFNKNNKLKKDQKSKQKRSKSKTIYLEIVQHPKENYYGGGAHRSQNKDETVAENGVQPENVNSFTPDYNYFESTTKNGQYHQRENEMNNECLKADIHAENEEAIFVNDHEPHTTEISLEPSMPKNDSNLTIRIAENSTSENKEKSCKPEQKSKKQNLFFKAFIRRPANKEKSQPECHSERDGQTEKEKTRKHSKKDPNHKKVHQHNEKEDGSKQVNEIFPLEETNLNEIKPAEPADTCKSKCNHDEPPKQSGNSNKHRRNRRSRRNRANQILSLDEKINKSSDSDHAVEKLQKNRTKKKKKKRIERENQSTSIKNHRFIDEKNVVEKSVNKCESLDEKSNVSNRSQERDDQCWKNNVSSVRTLKQRIVGRIFNHSKDKEKNTTFDGSKNSPTEPRFESNFNLLPGNDRLNIDPDARKILDNLKLPKSENGRMKRCKFYASVIYHPSSSSENEIKSKYCSCKTPDIKNTMHLNSPFNFVTPKTNICSIYQIRLPHNERCENF